MTATTTGEGTTTVPSPRGPISPYTKVHRHPPYVSDADLHELFEQVEGIDSDHPDYVELFDAWAVEREADIADRWAVR